jgi:predicted nucleic acid-binding protein
MDEIVLDCSTTMSWCFADEVNDEAAAILRAMPPLRAIVPPLWHLEVAQVLVKAERRARITESGSVRFLSLLDSLPIVEDETPHASSREILTLARTYQISAYDAAYLGCALRRGLPLATLDDRLRAAAISAGIALYRAPD